MEILNFKERVNLIVTRLGYYISFTSRTLSIFTFLVDSVYTRGLNGLL